MSKKSAVRRHRQGSRRPSASSVNQTHISDTGPPSATPESTTLRTQPAFGRHLWANGPMRGLYLSPQGSAAYPAAGRVTSEAAWDSGPWTSTWPLLPQGSPKHTGFEGACGLRTCGQWACGGLVQDAGRKVRRGVTHLPHGPITPPPTHLLPRAPSGHVSQRHEAALDTGAVHTEKRLDGVSGK